MIPPRVVSAARCASAIITVVLSIDTYVSYHAYKRSFNFFSEGTYAASQSFQSLLLGVRVDVGADNETDDVEEWYPGLLGQKLLCECKAQGRSNPADFHHSPKASSNRSANLVECARSRDNGHGGKVDHVLDR